MRRLVLVLIPLALWGCPRRGGSQSSAEGERPRFIASQVPEADAALERAIQVQESQPAQATEAYLAVRRAYPQSTAAQEALFRAGALYFASADFPNASKTLGELLFENPLFEKAREAKRMLGLSALELGAFRDAHQTLASLLERAEGAERRQLFLSTLRAAEGAQLYAEALRLSLQLADQASSAPEKVSSLARITELVEGRVGFLDLARARQELTPGHPAWPLLTFKLARIYYHLRDWQRLEETLQAFLREAPSHLYAEQARELLARAHRRGEVKPKVVGAILPMSGKYKPLGEAVLRGIQLALKGSELELVVKDSQGDVNLAGKQVEELAFDEGAIAVIGPLLGDEARRAALVAEELELPILTLAKSEEITALGPHVFRNMLTNAQQAEALAEYATATLGYKSFALLYPNLPFGVELANRFWDEVLKRGGEVRGAESYHHDQTTFTSEVKKLVGRYHLEDRADYRERLQEINQAKLDSFRKRKAVEKAKSELAPVVDFEALLIPDSWQRVGLVTPALAVEDVITNACDPRDLEKIRKTTGKQQLKTVTLLGTSTWNSPKGRSGVPELIERGGKFVSCSVFVDGFFADSARPSTRRFAAAYREAYPETQPTLLDATGYDSAGMLRWLLEKSAPRSRDQLTLQLSTLKGFEGATGSTRFNERREAVKPLFFLTIEGGQIKELLPQPKASGS